MVHDEKKVPHVDALSALTQGHRSLWRRIGFVDKDRLFIDRRFGIINKESFLSINTDLDLLIKSDHLDLSIKTNFLLIKMIWIY